jgi:hypothetical protein
VKCRGRQANTNFDISNYEVELQHVERVSKEELIVSLRRQSKGYSRGTSKYRGVTKHQKGRPFIALWLLRFLGATNPIFISISLARSFRRPLGGTDWPACGKEVSLLGPL